MPLAPGGIEVDGWVVERQTLPLTCPDGASARLYLVGPREAEAPLPVAVVLHPGALAHPTDGAPLPPALERSGAVRAVFATLGMADDGLPAGEEPGALARALAEEGIALALPTNCWGDLWRNGDEGGRRNDLDADGFSRHGFTAARLAWEAVADGASLPFRVDPDQRHLIGLGAGGWGIGELLHAGVIPASVAVDSAPADLDPYWEGDPVLYGPTVEALDRVFPEGPTEASETALAAAPLPDRAAYLYSSLDPTLPSSAHGEAAAAVAALPEGWVLDTGLPHTLPTRGDLALARDLAAFLLDPPPAGDPPSGR